MNRDLAILGLREGATKGQIKTAYEYRLHRYQAADFSDDPEYVRRKSDQLKRAFEAAYDAATETGEESTISRLSVYQEASASEYANEENQDQDQIQDQIQDQGRTYEPRTYEPREYEPEKYDHDQYEKGRRSAAEKGEQHSGFSDMRKLKDVAKTITDVVNDQCQSLFGEKSNTEGDQYKRVHRSTEEPDQGKRDGETPVDFGDSDENWGRGIKLSPGTLKTIGIVITIIVIFALAFMKAEKNPDDYSVEYNMEEQNSGYSYASNEERDQAVLNTAVEIRNTISSLSESSSYSAFPYTPLEFRRVGKKFTRKYFGQDSIGVLAAELEERYDDIFRDGVGVDAEKQMMQILEYFNFPSFEEVEGYIDPYNNEAIATKIDYMEYLCFYYDEYGMEASGSE